MGRKKLDPYEPFYKTFKLARLWREAKRRGITIDETGWYRLYVDEDRLFLNGEPVDWYPFDDPAWDRSP